MTHKEFADYVKEKYRSDLIAMLWDLSEKFPERDAISIKGAKGRVIIHINYNKKHHEQSNSR